VAALRWLIPVIILACGIAGRIVDPQPVRILSSLVFDTYQRIAPRPYTDAPVRIVDLDDETLSRLGQWPWPRTMLARLTDRLDELGAAAIAFGILFAEPDRTSPNRVAALWSDRTELNALRQELDGLPDHDQLFAKSIEASGKVVTAFALNHGQGGRIPSRKAGVSFGGDDPAHFIPRFTAAVTTLAQLEAPAAGSGHINRGTDPGGTVRWVPTFLMLEDALYPSLEMEALRIAQGGKHTHLLKASGASGEQSFGARTGVITVRVGEFTIPTGADGSIRLYDTGPVAKRFIPAWRVVEDDFPRDTLEGVIVLVGTSAAGLKDQVSTPLGQIAPGVEVHAQALEQIVTGNFLTRPDWAPGAEVLGLALAGGLLLIVMSRAGALAGAGLLAFGVVSVVGASWYAFLELHLLFDPVYPTAFVVLAYLVQSLVNFMRTEGEKRQIRTAFGRYLSPSLVERLADDPSHLRLGGETRTMTFLFSDIRGFTSISENFSAQELTRLINRFLTPVTDLLLGNGATIDKYMGDAVMAFWNAPLEDAHHAANACKAAVAMQKEMVGLNAKWKAQAEAEGHPHFPIKIGVGLNSGDACVGNLGSDQRFDYSVLGDDVNLASRLEGQSKTYDVGIVVGENTLKLAPNFAALELDLIRVKGKTRPVRIFALLGDGALATDPSFLALRNTHDELIGRYRAQDWPQAQVALEKCRHAAEASFDLSGLYDFYEGRLKAFAANPPPDDWDWVFDPGEK
jgi:adenylate cyclase